MQEIFARRRAIPLILLLVSVGRCAACDVDNPPRLFAATAKALQASILSPGHSLRFIAQNGYLPQSPVLVRLEVHNAVGARDWSLWDAEATLSVDQPGITLSTNRFRLRNGLGSVLLGISGSGDFNLIATVNGLQTNHLMQSLAGVPMTKIGGTLPGTSSTWTRLVLVTNDVTVPAGHTLTILSNTLVLVNGASSGTAASRILINGAINSAGTEDNPVTITSTNMSLNWGQIQHASAQPSTYRYTTICKAGRAAGEGHTATAPTVKLTGSTVLFEGCNITDAIATSVSNGIGKIMQADNSNVTFDNCLLTRARMGPEIAGTALLCTNSYLMEMYGPDDADGIYLHDAGALALKIRGCVIAVGDDDAIDTLGSIVQVDNTIIRDFCDKAISVLDGSLRVDKALIVDDTHGVSAKSQSSNTIIPLDIDRTTIAVATNGIAVINKFGGPTNVSGIYHVTNTIIRASFSVVTDYDPANFHLRYCNVSPSFSGVGNIASNNAALAAIVLGSPGITTNLPSFVDPIANDFHLSPGSPCIDTGDPAAPLDADGSPIDVGCFTFVPPAPALEAPQQLLDGTFQFLLRGYTNRNYVIEAADTLTNWTLLKTITQTVDPTLISDATAPDATHRLYRGRLAP